MPVAAKNGLDMTCWGRRHVIRNASKMSCKFSKSCQTLGPKVLPSSGNLIELSNNVHNESQRQVGAATSGSLDLPRRHQPHFDASPVPLDVVGVERDGHGQRSCVRARTCPIAALHMQCFRCTVGIILPPGSFQGRILVPLYCWRSSRIDIADLPRRVSQAWPTVF